MIQITTETTHDHAQVHLQGDDIEIGSMRVRNWDTITLNLGDLTVFLSIEQAKTLNESITDALLDSVAVKEGE